MIEAGFDKQLFSARGEQMTLAVDLSLPDQEFCAVFGASGAGKTTLLRILAGLTQPDGGRIVVDGEVWYDSSAGINRPVQQRRIGFVFQDYALFPNMTVRQNLLFAREPGGEPGAVDQLLAMTGLTGLAGRRPATLSGGQRQRVALARALVRRPRLLLLDEPLSALDGETRVRLQDELALLHREFGVTVLLVSHDLGEIFRLAQRVVVLEQGRISRQGTPEDVFIDHRISGKFKFTGQVLAIQPNGLVYILTVLVGNNIVKVLGMAEEVAAMRVGDQVRLSAKAFNPLITPLKA